MTCVAKVHQRADVPQLPREVVQYIFSVKEPPNLNGRSEVVLSLDDRLRALAVCRAWKTYLDPRTWPIEKMNLTGKVLRDLSVAVWVGSKRPALRSLKVLEFPSSLLLVMLMSISPRVELSELALYCDPMVIMEALTPLGFLTGLKALTLGVSPDKERGGKVDLGLLKPLVALRRLSCSRLQLVNLRAGPVLPQLASLEVLGVEMIAINATLPALERMTVAYAQRVGLVGEGLQLPQLSKLSLLDNWALTVKWQAAPQLAALALTTQLPDFTSDGLSALQRLTCLTLGGSQEAVHALLAAAPPSVRHLDFQRYIGDWAQPPQLGALPQVTSLTCHSPAIIPHLGPLTQLQHLDFPSKSVLDLSLEQVDWLCSLPSLVKLRFGARLNRIGALDRRMQVLTRALPTGGTLHQTLLEYSR